MPIDVTEMPDGGILYSHILWLRWPILLQRGSEEMVALWHDILPCMAGHGADVRLLTAPREWASGNSPQHSDTILVLNHPDRAVSESLKSLIERMGVPYLSEDERSDVKEWLLHRRWPGTTFAEGAFTMTEDDLLDELTRESSPEPPIPGATQSGVVHEVLIRPCTDGRGPGRVMRLTDLGVYLTASRLVARAEAGHV